MNGNVGKTFLFFRILVFPTSLHKLVAFDPGADSWLNKMLRVPVSLMKAMSVIPSLLKSANSINGIFDDPLVPVRTSVGLTS